MPTTLTASPTQTSELTPDEQAAFDEARERWSEYESASAPLWEAGMATPDATALFQSYFVSPVWQQYLERLRTYEASQITVSGVPTVLWSKPGRIRLSNDGASVVVQQCVDYSSQIFTQAGQPVDRYPYPVRRRATLDRAGDEAEFLLLRIDEPAGDDVQRCEGSAS